MVNKMFAKGLVELLATLIKQNVNYRLWELLAAGCWKVILNIIVHEWIQKM
jgi:hypothetical protein